MEILQPKHYDRFPYMVILIPYIAMRRKEKKRKQILDLKQEDASVRDIYVSL